MSFGTILYTILISPLQMFFEFIFGFAQRFTNNPGLSIIVLSLVMNFLVLPLYKRADAMQAEERDTEAKLHDGLAHIKKAFSGDERMMIQQEYYRQNHYKTTDAFKGSISLFLEIPFFIAAYQFLSTMAALHGVSFGPIADLGTQDALLQFGGFSINLLPILMTTINIISCVIYTKGYPLKTKIQLYIMAAFFLFFLYDSPAGLLFYWTLNNLFSLLKNIFYKMKNPKKVLAWMASIVGALTAVYGLLFSSFSMKYRLVLFGIGICLQLPIFIQWIQKKKVLKSENVEYKPSKKMYLLGALLLTVIIGLLIPSSVIKSSPQEFVNLYDYHHPVWYIVSALCLSFGTFIVWFGVFYWLADKKGKVLFEKLIWILCGIAVMDYMFFGTDLGIMSSVLKFDDEFSFTILQKLINLALIVILIIVMAVTFKRYKKVVTGALATGIIAVVCMSVVNIQNIYASTAKIKTTGITSENDGYSTHFTFSKTGKNVVVLMLDRAVGEYMPYIFNEKPELQQQFDGFTYYQNTVSYGMVTNTGSPALFGGYEYTPYEMDKRNTESLVSKQNEALKVMPVLFEQNGYDVNVCDVPYANYQWISDLSIYDGYPNIQTHHTIGMVNSEAEKNVMFDADRRNFFCYSLMKTAPLALQNFLYNSGEYFQVKKYTADTDSSVFADDPGQIEFMKNYYVMESLSDMTTVTDENENSFLMMNNDITHSDNILKEPEYEPSSDIDNTEYDATHADRFTLNGVTIDMTSDDRAYTHYDVDMCAMIQLGKWFDYLKANGVYDNTRIILVSDHGFPLQQYADLSMTKDDGEVEDLNGFFPLLMEKDFNSTGFTTSTEFMTNGDVPTLATQNLIQNATNPFTGKAITNTAKSGKQYLFASTIYDVEVNNGNVFLPGDWYSVHDDASDINNWSKEASNSSLPTSDTK